VPIKILTRQLFTSQLEQVGINPGDGLLIHSAIQYLGQPDGGIEMIFQCLKNLLTISGTIAVPTFNFDFAKGEEFKTKETPSKGMGVFSEFIRVHPGSFRTHHPLQSIAINGFHAAEIANRDTLCAFDDGSAFERMLDLNFKCLLLGANINACSIIHYSEQRSNVPYRYWKNFSGIVDGKYATYRMFVRDLELNPLLDLTPIKVRLMEQGLWNQVQINYGILASFTLQDFCNSADELLSKDPFCLLFTRESVIDKLIKHRKETHDR
jgi:aminoglycoside 3-N-acetyltransferase